MDIKEIVLLAAKYADDKKAEDIKIIDLQGKSSLCDYIIIATVTSAPHLEAVEQEISKNLKQEGVYKTNRDGGDSASWRVSDYGNFLLHLMTAEAREKYNLDGIFSFGKEIDLRAPASAAEKQEKVMENNGKDKKEEGSIEKAEKFLLKEAGVAARAAGRFVGKAEKVIKKAIKTTAVKAKQADAATKKVVAESKLKTKKTVDAVKKDIAKAKKAAPGKIAAASKALSKTIDKAASKAKKAVKTVEKKASAAVKKTAAPKKATVKKAPAKKAAAKKTAVKKTTAAKKPAAKTTKKIVKKAAVKKAPAKKAASKKTVKKAVKKPAVKKTVKKAAKKK